MNTNRKIVFVLCNWILCIAVGISQSIYVCLLHKTENYYQKQRESHTHDHIYVSICMCFTIYPYSGDGFCCGARAHKQMHIWLNWYCWIQTMCKIALFSYHSHTDTDTDLHTFMLDSQWRKRKRVKWHKQPYRCTENDRNSFNSVTKQIFSSFLCIFILFYCYYSVPAWICTNNWQKKVHQNEIFEIRLSAHENQFYQCILLYFVYSFSKFYIIFIFRIVFFSHWWTVCCCYISSSIL